MEPGSPREPFRLYDPPAPRELTRETWLRQVARDAATGDWILAAIDAERANDPRRARAAWTQVLAQGPATVGWPALAVACARLGRRSAAKAAWLREARLRASRDEWLDAAVAETMAGERAAWTRLAQAATRGGDHALAHTAWEQAGERVQAAAAAAREAALSGKGHRSERHVDSAWAFDAADWWEAAGLPGRAEAARTRAERSEAPFGAAGGGSPIESSTGWAVTTQRRRLAAAAPRAMRQPLAAAATPAVSGTLARRRAPQSWSRGAPDATDGARDRSEVRTALEHGSRIGQAEVEQGAA